MYVILKSTQHLQYDPLQAQVCSFGDSVISSRFSTLLASPKSQYNKSESRQKDFCVVIINYIISLLGFTTSANGNNNIHYLTNDSWF